jgi:hypothetical protein
VGIQPRHRLVAVAQHRRSRTEPAWLKFKDHIPEEEQTLVYESFVIPYESLLEVDPFGEPHLQGVHLLCRFQGRRGPYTGGSRFRSAKLLSRGFVMERYLEPADRQSLYKELEAQLAGSAP